MSNYRIKSSAGQSLIETLIALAIFGIVMVSFLSSVINLTTPQVKYRHRIQASHYAREGLEIAYNLAVNSTNWNNFVAAYANKTLHPTTTGDLELTSGTETLEGKFERGISFQIEGNSLKTISRISWTEQNRLENIELVTYLIDFSQF